MHRMAVDELHERLDRREVVLIDVREKAEHQAESICGALSIPLGELTWEKIPSTSAPIVFHCVSGRRSEEACKKLLGQNPRLALYSLEGGLIAWKEAGFITKKGKQQVLSIHRQTQIIAGVYVLAGVVLGSFYHPLFYSLSGLVGVGLLFSGMTGWCGMARVLAKMPWNRE